MLEYINTIPKRIWYTLIVCSVSPFLVAWMIWSENSNITKKDSWNPFKIPF